MPSRSLPKTPRVQAPHGLDWQRIVVRRHYSLRRSPAGSTMDEMQENQENDLIDFVAQAQKHIEDEYRRITRRSSEDPGTAGDEGEENWASLLRDWLPTGYQVVTKGRILSATGTASSQVDVIILRPCYPSGLIRMGKKLYLAAGVAAAFSCKLTARAGGIVEACRKACEIKRLAPTREGSPLRELYAPLVFGFLAHSHSWDAPSSRPLDNVVSNIARGLDQAGHPREVIDLVCVADLGSTRVYKAPDLRVFNDLSVLSPVSGPSPVGVSYARPDQSSSVSRPVGGLICDLLQMLSFEDECLFALWRHFAAAGLSTTGKLPWDRVWQGAGVYSTKTQLLLPFSLRNDAIAHREWALLI